MTGQPQHAHSLLIANRGEIACRVIRSAKALGLRTIAVYSDIDADAPHVQQADEAFLLGPAPVNQSYLDAGRILEAAQTTGADMIHPGYGFLSENADFATACIDAGHIFIGPDANAIDLMGDKAKAKRAMVKAGIPCIPGYQGKDQSDTALIAAAKDIGFPIMVKAAAGGGGRGMRLVENKQDLVAAVKTARSEAQNAFGDGALILERALNQPRHIEIQIFADRHGHIVHLGERDCSVQRRHQKVLEEAPAPDITPDLRAAMGAVAINVARDINYVGAGTVEFLLDSTENFYFLEMNTRLQVEHPVTEMVTGVDLVALQIRVAQGYVLGFAQDDIKSDGHAIEARLYAEDTGQDFLPATGSIDLWHPATGDSVRVDAGIETGGFVSPFYDPMLAKIIAHGATREEARGKLVQALKETVLLGVITNKSFLINALERPEFIKSQITTGFIAQCFSKDDLAPDDLQLEDAIAASAIFYICARKRAFDHAITLASPLLNWASARPIATQYRFFDGENNLDLSVSPDGSDSYQVCCGDKEFSVRISDFGDHYAIVQINNTRKKYLFNQPVDDATNSKLQLSIDGRDVYLKNLYGATLMAQQSPDTGSVTTPMHGVLVKIFISPGDTVTKGQPVAILEAMKMQHELTAGIDGVIEVVHFTLGAQVSANALLMEIKEYK